MYHVLPCLNDIEACRREQIEGYFASAPAWLLDSIQVVQIEKDVVLVKENAPVDMIYMVLKGIVKAVDYRIYGIAFDFMQFNEFYAFGGMEILMDDKVYRTTLETVTPCMVLRIPKGAFAKWMHSDIIALKKESKNVASYLLEQGRKARAFLFLQGANRLAFFLVENYPKYQKNHVFYVSSTRQELSEASGLCVKTVNRAVKKFEENGWITKRGNKFSINEEQFKALYESISDLIEC